MSDEEQQEMFNILLFYFNYFSEQENRQPIILTRISLAISQVCKRERKGERKNMKEGKREKYSSFVCFFVCFTFYPRFFLRRL